MDETERKSPGEPGAAPQPGPEAPTPRRDAEVADAPASPADGGGSGGSEEDVKKAVLESLENVIDPELGINIVDLGLVYDLSLEGGTVHITYTLTTMGCPIGPLIESQMQQTLAHLDSVDNVEAEMVFSPPWTPDKMSDEAKAALGVV